MYNTCRKKGIGMEFKYYFGCAINPQEERTSDFDDNTKIRCVIKFDGNEFRELVTEAKYFPIKEHEVIDGNKLFDMDASLVGTINEILENMVIY